MAADFDPYYKWLGIPPDQQPPNRYRLLSLDNFEDDPEVIEAAANRYMLYLHELASGPDSKYAQQLLNEISTARVSLLDPKRKAKYDAELLGELEAQTGAVRQVESTERPAPKNAQVEGHQTKPATARVPRGDQPAGTPVAPLAVATPLPPANPIASPTEVPAHGRAAPRRHVAAQRRDNGKTIVVAVAVVGVILVAVGGLLRLASSESHNEERQVAVETIAGVRAPPPVDDLADPEAQETAEPVGRPKTRAGTSPSDESIDEESRSGGPTSDRNEQAPTETDPPQASAPPGLEAAPVPPTAVARAQIDNELAPAAEPLKEAPAIENPMADPAQLLASKKLSLKSGRWLVSEEVELPKKLEALRATRADLKDLQKNLAKARRQIAGLQVRTAAATNAGAQPPALEQARKRIASDQQRAQEMENKILDKRAELQQLSADANAALQRADQQYQQLAQDKAVTAAIDKLGGELGPSVTWNRTKTAVKALTKGFDSKPKGGAARLIGHWVFDAANLKENRIRDLARNNPALIAGKIQFAEKEKAAGLLLDGSTNSALIAEVSQTALPGVISAEALVRVDSGLKWGCVVGAFQDNHDYERGWLLGLNETTFSFTVASAAGPGRMTYMPGKTPFAAGKVHHVVGTYDGMTMKLYVDGRLDNSSTVQRGLIMYPPKAFFEIGAFHDQDDYFRMTGAVYEVRVYAGALSAEEVADRFAQLDAK